MSEEQPEDSDSLTSVAARLRHVLASSSLQSITFELICVMGPTRCDEMISYELKLLTFLSRWRRIEVSSSEKGYWARLGKQYRTIAL
jgi:hypothetical protein